MSLEVWVFKTALVDLVRHPAEKQFTQILQLAQNCYLRHHATMYYCLLLSESNSLGFNLIGLSITNTMKTGTPSRIPPNANSCGTGFCQRGTMTRNIATSSMKQGSNNHTYKNKTSNIGIIPVLYTRSKNLWMRKSKAWNVTRKDQPGFNLLQSSSVHLHGLFS